MFANPIPLLLLSFLSVGLTDAVSANTLARNVERLESVREIKDVQKSFAQLAQFGRWADMADLFLADNGTLHWGHGGPLDTNNADIVKGPTEIEKWLREDAGDMDGIKPGSLHTHLNEMPLVSLSEDGRTAKARWQVLRLLGDGAGKTRIQGGVYEKEYVRVNGDGESLGWKISLLRYYPMTAGDYAQGWGNVGSGSRTLPIIPYHFTPDEAGIPIPLPRESDSDSEIDVADLAYRVSRLNAEDDVRNLQHAYGYYMDQRMWTDVLDLCNPDSDIIINGIAHTGLDNIRGALEGWMGPESLAQGILNEHPIFDTMVEVSGDGKTAVARGLEMGLIGDAGKKAGAWEFNIFRNSFGKDADSGLWKIKTINITRLIEADYYPNGWADGGNLPSKQSTIEPPEFLSHTWRRSHSIPEDYYSAPTTSGNSTEALLETLEDQLAQSLSFDESENVGSAYGYFADDIRCQMFADLHAEKGFKESPGVGWYYTRDRIAQACLARYNTNTPNPQRPNVPFHWRLQPVIIPSRDGRSTSMRTKLLQFGTSSGSKGGFNGVWGFNGGMYHDQFILEETANGTARRKLWCLTIDEFYWQSRSWSGGWAGAGQRKRDRISPRQGLNNYPPDVDLKNPKLGDRERGFAGGPTETVAYPAIQPMWFSYRNPVSGRLPQHYWGPGCVPCRGAKPEWALMENGFQEPPTGPSIVSAIMMEGSRVVGNVTAGPEEAMSGIVELWDDNDVLLQSGSLGEDGSFSFTLSADESPENDLVVAYRGNDILRGGRGKVI